MKSAITCCLIPEAAAGPFVLHRELESACEMAAALGYDAVEVFPSSPDDPKVARLSDLLDRHALQLSAIGTGGGWILHQWSLTSVDAEVRELAKGYIRGMIDLAGRHEASVILGSMQGRIDRPENREQQLDWLATALRELGDYAMDTYGRPIFFEPLNRYESNVWNRLRDTLRWLEDQDCRQVLLLADLFHMNIEEASMIETLRTVAARLGHVHWADSNRLAMGLGHTPYTEILDCLQQLQYRGFLSAEVFPLPTVEEAARRSWETMRSGLLADVESPDLETGRADLSSASNPPFHR